MAHTLGKQDLDGLSVKDPAGKIEPPISIKISGAGFALETMISMETAMRVVQCINQAND